MSDIDKLVDEAEQEVTAVVLELLAERDALQVRVDFLEVEKAQWRDREAALEAENARLREASRLKPMSEAKHREECTLRTRTGYWIVGMVDILDQEVICDGMNSPIEFAVGFVSLPEVQDNEHYHE